MYQCFALLFPSKASVLFGFLPSRHNCFCSPCSRTAPTGVKVWLSKGCRSGLCLYVTSLAACYYRPSTQSSAVRRVVVTLPLSSFPTVLLTVGKYCPFSLFRVWSEARNSQEQYGREHHGTFINVWNQRVYPKIWINTYTLGCAYLPNPTSEPFEILLTCIILQPSLRRTNVISLLKTIVSINYDHRNMGLEGTSIGHLVHSPALRRD